MNAVLADEIIRWSWVGDHLHEIWHALVQHLELTFIAVSVGFAISVLLAALAIRFRIVYQPIVEMASGTRVISPTRPTAASECVRRQTWMNTATCVI